MPKVFDQVKTYIENTQTEKNLTTLTVTEDPSGILTCIEDKKGTFGVSPDKGISIGNIEDENTITETHLKELRQLAILKIISLKIEALKIEFDEKAIVGNGNVSASLLQLFAISAAKKDKNALKKDTFASLGLKVYIEKINDGKLPVIAYAAAKKAFKESLVKLDGSNEETWKILRKIVEAKTFSDLKDINPNKGLIKDITEDRAQNSFLYFRKNTLDALDSNSALDDLKEIATDKALDAVLNRIEGCNKFKEMAVIRDAVDFLRDANDALCQIFWSNKDLKKEKLITDIVGALSPANRTKIKEACAHLVAKNELLLAVKNIQKDKLSAAPLLSKIKLAKNWEDLKDEKGEFDDLAALGFQKSSLTKFQKDSDIKQLQDVAADKAFEIAEEEIKSIKEDKIDSLREIVDSKLADLSAPKTEAVLNHLKLKEIISAVDEKRISEVIIIFERQLSRMTAKKSVLNKVNTAVIPDQSDYLLGIAESKGIDIASRTGLSPEIISALTQEDITEICEASAVRIPKEMLISAIDKLKETDHLGGFLKIIKDTNLDSLKEKGVGGALGLSPAVLDKLSGEKDVKVNRAIARKAKKAVLNKINNATPAMFPRLQNIAESKAGNFNVLRADLEAIGISPDMVSVLADKNVDEICEACAVRIPKKMLISAIDQLPDDAPDLSKVLKIIKDKNLESLKDEKIDGVLKLSQDVLKQLPNGKDGEVEEAVTRKAKRAVINKINNAARVMFSHLQNIAESKATDVQSLASVAEDFHRINVSPEMISLLAKKEDIVKICEACAIRVPEEVLESAIKKLPDDSINAGAALFFIKKVDTLDQLEDLKDEEAKPLSVFKRVLEHLPKVEGKNVKNAAAQKAKEIVFYYVKTIQGEKNLSYLQQVADSKPQTIQDLIPLLKNIGLDEKIISALPNDNTVVPELVKICRARSAQQGVLSAIQAVTDKDDLEKVGLAILAIKRTNNLSKLKDEKDVELLLSWELLDVLPDESSDAVINEANIKVKELVQTKILSADISVCQEVIKNFKGKSTDLWNNVPQLAQMGLKKELVEALPDVLPIRQAIVQRIIESKIEKLEKSDLAALTGSKDQQAICDEVIKADFGIVVEEEGVKNLLTKPQTDLVFQWAVLQLVKIAIESLGVHDNSDFLKDIAEKTDAEISDYINTKREVFYIQLPETDELQNQQNFFLTQAQTQTIRAMAAFKYAQLNLEKIVSLTPENTVALVSVANETKPDDIRNQLNKTKNHFGNIDFKSITDPQATCIAKKSLNRLCDLHVSSVKEEAKLQGIYQAASIKNKQGLLQLLNIQNLKPEVVDDDVMKRIGEKASQGVKDIRRQRAQETQYKNRFRLLNQMGHAQSSDEKATIKMFSDNQITPYEFAKISEVVQPGIIASQVEKKEDAGTVQLSVVLKDGGKLSRTRLDSTTAKYEIQGGKLNLQQKFAALAQATKKEFELKGKNASRDKVELRKIQAPGEKAELLNQLCRDAFEKAGFKNIEIDAPDLAMEIGYS